MYKLRPSFPSCGCESGAAGLKLLVLQIYLRKFALASCIKRKRLKTNFVLAWFCSGLRSSVSLEVYQGFQLLLFSQTRFTEYSIWIKWRFTYQPKKNHGYGQTIFMHARRLDTVYINHVHTRQNVWMYEKCHVVWQKLFLRKKYLHMHRRTILQIPETVMRVCRAHRKEFPFTCFENCEKVSLLCRNVFPCTLENVHLHYSSFFLHVYTLNFSHACGKVYTFFSGKCHFRGSSGMQLVLDFFIVKSTFLYNSERSIHSDLLLCPPFTSGGLYHLSLFVDI